MFQNNKVQVEKRPLALQVKRKKTPQGSRNFVLRHIESIDFGWKN
jgi:hypothetical protein